MIATFLTALDSSIAEAKRLRATLKRNKAAQVWSSDERNVVKGTALSWFNSHRPEILAHLQETDLVDIDKSYRDLLMLADRAGSRSKYDGLLKQLPKSLSSLRASKIVATQRPIVSADTAPDFSPLIADQKMQAIITNRWAECGICISAGASLAATVMMGGLLEAILLGRVNRESNKSPIFSCKSAPRDKTGKTKPLNEWALKNHIEVSHELGWITVSAKDVGAVLRDYRNYVHPYKEFSHGVKLEAADASLLWEITKNICRQVLKKVP